MWCALDASVGAEPCDASHGPTSERNVAVCKSACQLAC